MAELAVTTYDEWIVGCADQEGVKNQIEQLQ
jgi:hypothetical protein